MGLDSEKLAYSKVSSAPEDYPDEIDLELSNSDKAADDEKGCCALSNKPSDNNGPLIQDLLQDEVEQLSSPQDGQHYQNIMDELVLSSNPIQEPQSLFQLTKSATDLIDIDLDSPPEDINWDSLLKPTLTSIDDIGGNVGGGESWNGLESKDTKSNPLNQELGNSVFQKKFEEDENPYMV